jgi:V-type H+-transporting ATPase subunit A
MICRNACSGSAWTEDQKCTLEVARFISEDFLQQNGFTDYDLMCALANTIGMMKVIVGFHEAAQKVIAESSGDSRIGWNHIAANRGTWSTRYGHVV